MIYSKITVFLLVVLLFLLGNITQLVFNYFGVSIALAKLDYVPCE